MVERPMCSGVVTARAVSPFGIGAKKLVLLSIVAVRCPSGRAATVVMPPMISPQPMIAPPCITPRRLVSSSRTTNSASLRCAVRMTTLMPIGFRKGPGSQAVMLDPCAAWRRGESGRSACGGAAGALFQIAYAPVCCPAGRASVVALVAQLDRAPDFDSGGRGFESLRARHPMPRGSCAR